MKKTSIFKTATVSSLAMLMGQQAMSFDQRTCFSDDRKNAVMYYPSTTLEISKDIVFFNYMRIEGVDYYGGSGTMMGKGKVGEKTLDLELTWTNTGYHDSNRVGKLKGKKVNNEWIFSLTPWNKNTQKYDSERKVIMQNCQITNII